MRRKLVLVHGRSQQHKEPVALKAEWSDAFKAGLAKSKLPMPLDDADIRFPFYGDTLYDLVDGRSVEEAAKVIVRGAADDSEEAAFTRDLLAEIRTQAGITDAQIAAVGGQQVVERGIQNVEWIQACLSAIDRYVPHGSGAAVALFTRDVYRYLKDTAIRQEIETGVAGAMTPGVETVVVSHSLGTVVAYNLLQREGKKQNWQVPLFVTLGSPIAITSIRKTLTGFATARCPPCVARWFNAMDPRDVVALYPLAPAHFPLNPVEPAIQNKTDVVNGTSNRHGISGYLDDQEVARTIYDALMAT